MVLIVTQFFSQRKNNFTLKIFFSKRTFDIHPTLSEIINYSAKTSDRILIS